MIASANLSWRRARAILVLGTAAASLWAAASPSDELPPGHPPLSGGAPPSAEALIQRLDSTPGLKEKPKTFDVAAALGKLYYGSARYADAAEYFKQAEAIAKSSNPKVKDADRLEVKKLRGHALVLTGHPASALAEYDGALKIDPSRDEIRFFRACVLVESRGDEPRALRQALEDLKQVGRGQSPLAHSERVNRFQKHVEAAIAAGGISALAAKTPASPAPASPPPLSQEVIDAIQNTPRTAELETGLSRLVEEGEDHLAHGRYQQALDVYKRVVPFQPENGRAKAGMAWSLVGLGRQPMADRIWSVAVGADPAAVDRLGQTLKDKGDLAGAKALWAKLSASDPTYASKAGIDRR